MGTWHAAPLQRWAAMARAAQSSPIWTLWVPAAPQGAWTPVANAMAQAASLMLKAVAAAALQMHAVSAAL